MSDDAPRLARYGDLTVRGVPFDQLVDNLDDHLGDGWSRATDIEESRRGFDLGGRQPAIYSQTGERGLAAANLYLLERGNGSIYVPNVVPATTGSIDEGQYNALLEDFHNRVLAPAVGDGMATVDLDTGAYDLADRASPEVADALRRFSLLANKSTGASHPTDAERFDDFVIAASELPAERCPDAGIIGEWLMADGWDDERAWDLSLQYETGLRLLDRRRATRRD